MCLTLVDVTQYSILKNKKDILLLLYYVSSNDSTRKSVLDKSV